MLREKMEMKACMGSDACLVGTVVGLMLLGMQTSTAGPIRRRLAERRAERVQDGLQREEAERDGVAAVPAGVMVVRDVAYGNDERQRFDVYHTADAHHAPVIFMVHGGGWRWGDKAMRRVVEAKVAHWVPKGFVLISVNYRMLPTDPVDQARDVAQALAVAQRRANEWGGDRDKFILMGHSAGAHLVMLVATSRSIAGAAAPWLGTVSLDSGALDVVSIMERRHLRLYDNAFGSDPKLWRSASPFYALSAGTRPILAVCSSRRADSCAEARRFVAKAKSLGATAEVLPKDLAHREINALLGDESTYTAEVDAFLARLDPTVASLLARSPTP
jgi:arylformamidase